MRIADHAVALQSSQALQQPANATHQQQILAGEMASASLAREVEKKNVQVNETERPENKVIRAKERKGSQSEEKASKGDRSRRGQPVDDEEIVPPDSGGSGNLLDITV